MTRQADPDRPIAQALRLREPPPVAARLSRRVLAVLAGTAAAGLAGVVALSLRTPHPRAPGETLPAAPAEAPAPPGLAALPKDYLAPPPDAPRLGPPLPGDLGRPMLQSPPVSPSREPGVAGPSAGSGSAVDEARQAHASRLAVAVTARPDAPAPAATKPPPDPPRAPAAAPLVLQAGSVIRAALISGVSSEAAGPVLAQVTEDVFDSAGARRRLIPQGARLMGTYERAVTFGQDRLSLVWDRLLLPDGRSVELGGAVAADAQGRAGLADRTERHWRRLAGAALVSTLLAMGAEAGATGEESRILQALRQGGSNAASQAGQQLVGRALDVRPVIVLRPGLPVRALVTRDLQLEPWPQ